MQMTRLGAVVIASLCVGVMLGFDLANHSTVPIEAMRIARQQVESEMRVACSNWFTDKRSSQLPAGRVVVCHAPKFLSNMKG